MIRTTGPPGRTGEREFRTMRRNVHSVAWILVLVTATLTGCNSAWVSSGIIYRDQQGDYAKAEEMFKRAIDRSDGTEAIAWYELGNTLIYRVENEHLANGEVDSARIKVELAHESYVKAAELKPEEYDFNPDAEDEADQRVVENAIRAAYSSFYNGGVERMRSGRYDEAITWFEMAGLADPRGAAGFDARLIRSQLRFNQQTELDAAERDSEVLRSVLADLESLEVDPAWEESAEKKTTLVESKSQVLRALGRDSEANVLFEQLLESDPNNVELIAQVASARQESGEYEAAGTLLERAFRLSAEDPAAEVKNRVNYGILAVNSYLRAENYEKLLGLVDAVETYAAGNKDRAVLYTAKARAHYALEENELAITAAEAVVLDGGFDPNNLPAWQIYYRALRNVGRNDDSEAAFNRFNALRSGS